MTSKIRTAIKSKHATWRSFKSNPSTATKSAFVQIRNQVTSLIRTAKRTYLTTLHRDIRLTNSTSSVRLFWRRLKSLSGRLRSSAIPDLQVKPRQGLPAEVASTDADKANVLNSFFAAQTRLIDCPSSVSNLSRQVPSESSFYNLSTSPNNVYDVFTHLKPGKAAGLDDIPPRLLPECARGVSVSLSELFNRSFVECQLPQEWKDALVVPIFKSGQKSSPTNYRPIALLSLVSKSLEKTVFRKLNSYLQPFITKSQLGFRGKDSTQKQLVCLIQEWASAMDSAEYVGVVVFDSKKAFDRVWHDGLLEMLSSFGVKGRALKWLHSFLMGRRQCVAVGGAVSDTVALEAGVPQGAILSPPSFSLFI